MTWRKVVMQFTIENLTVTDRDRVEQAAMLLHSAFAPLGVWTTMAEARQEVVESIAANRVSRRSVARWRSGPAATTSPEKRLSARSIHIPHFRTRSAPYAAGDAIPCPSTFDSAFTSSVWCRTRMDPAGRTSFSGNGSGRDERQWLNSCGSNAHRRGLALYRTRTRTRATRAPTIWLQTEAAMAQATAQNQRKIISNQSAIIANQTKILRNQKSILTNQKRIIRNQGKILKK